MNIQEYINCELPKCVRFHPDDMDTLIGLPYPYSIPCASDNFQEMYYWDTYFTNLGLLTVGNTQQAINNAENMFALVKRYGFMPNGNRTYYLNNSQPPFLSLMVRDIYEKTGDLAWLEKAFSVLETEHRFWQKNRMTECGLNRYDCMPLQTDDIKNSAECLIERIGYRPVDMSESELARAMFSGGESGWDMNPRMTYKTYEYAPVDLNALLYALEDNLSSFAKLLGFTEAQEKYAAARDERAKLCRKYLMDENGVYYDYKTVTKKRSCLFSAASFYPLYCGMASVQEAEATIALLPKLETNYGILTCEQNSVPGNYQWDAPNGWAPMQQMVVGGLLRYGCGEDALRIAGNFKGTIENCFDKTGSFWEKYNVITGSIDAANEYAMPAMMGWTFGVYAVFRELQGMQ